jgi:hypothetical protein
LQIRAQKQYATLNEYLQAVRFGQLEAVQAAGLDESYFSKSKRTSSRTNDLNRTGSRFSFENLSHKRHCGGVPQDAIAPLSAFKK